MKPHAKQYGERPAGIRRQQRELKPGASLIDDMNHITGKAEEIMAAESMNDIFKKNCKGCKVDEESDECTRCYIKIEKAVHAVRRRVRARKKGMG